MIDGAKHNILVSSLLKNHRVCLEKEFWELELKSVKDFLKMDNKDAAHMTMLSFLLAEKWMQTIPHYSIKSTKKRIKTLVAEWIVRETGKDFWGKGQYLQTQAQAAK